MHPRPLALLEKVNANLALILQKLTSIVELATIEGKPEETLAVETLQIESDAAMIIRLAEELLTVSRTIKETWILGQLLLDDREMELIEEEMTAKVGGLVERVLQLEQRAAKVLAE